MRPTLLIALLATMLASCAYTDKIAYRDAVKSYTHNPGQMAELHVKWFPLNLNTETSVTEQLITGEEKPLPPGFIDCDSLVKAAAAGAAVDPSKVEVPGGTKRVDTFRVKEKERVEVERTDRLEAMQHMIELAEEKAAAEREKRYEAEADNIHLRALYDQERQKNKKKTYWIIGLVGYSAIRMICKFKFPFIYKFLL